MKYAKLAGAKSLPTYQGIEIVYKRTHMGSGLPLPEGRLYYADDAGLSHGFIIIGGARNHMDMWIEILHLTVLYCVASSRSEFPAGFLPDNLCVGNHSARPRTHRMTIDSASSALASSTGPREFALQNHANTCRYASSGRLSLFEKILSHPGKCFGDSIFQSIYPGYIHLHEERL